MMNDFGKTTPMQHNILNTLRRSDNPLSFPQLQEAVPNSTGKYWAAEPDTRLVYWTGCSKEFLLALKDLAYMGALFITTGSEARTAYTDATPPGMPPLPVADSMTTHAKWHWLPVAYHLSPSLREFDQLLDAVNSRTPASFILNVRHDYDCPQLLGTGECACSPDIDCQTADEFLEQLNRKARRASAKRRKQES